MVVRIKRRDGLHALQMLATAAGFQAACSGHGILNELYKHHKYILLCTEICASSVPHSTQSKICID